MRLTLSFRDLVNNDRLSATVDLIVGLYSQFLAVSREVASIVTVRHRPIERVVFPTKDVVAMLAETSPTFGRGSFSLASTRPRPSGMTYGSPILYTRG